MEKIVSVGIKVALIILFACCLLNMPYGYFQLVRAIGLISFGLLAYFNKNPLIIGFYIGSAILINPIIKIPLGRHIWNIVDITWVVILLIIIIFELINFKKSV